MEENKKKTTWINVAKASSIFGVVLQHVYGYLYSNDLIYYSVWWSVALFIMIGGYNAAESYERRRVVVVRSRLRNTLMPYIGATVFYVLYNYFRFKVPPEILIRLIRFDASPPLWFVAIYVQLVLISPILVAVIQWCEERQRVIRYLISWIIVIIVCYGITYIINLFGSEIYGGHLVAGTWLFFWFLGMCIHNTINIESNDMKTRIVMFIVNTVLIILWQIFFVNMGVNLNLDSMFKGVYYRLTWANALQTVLLFFWIKDLVMGIEYFCGKIGHSILNPIDLLGQHTMYIFLYHMVFLSEYRLLLETPGWVNKWFCMVFILFGPLALDFLFSKVKDLFKNLMKEIQIT